MMKLFKLLFAPFRLLGLVLRPLSRRLAVQLERQRPDQKKAQRYATSALAEFKRLGFSRRVGVGKKKKRQHVRFEYPLLLTPDELWCPIDLRRLPQGVRTDDLRAEDVLRSIEDRLHAPVRVDYLANNKLCLVIGTRGVRFPEKISINAFQLDPDAPALAIPLGVDRDGQHSLVDLAELKHCIIAGATGGGKTTLQHTIINTFINRNSVDDLELWLIDLKGTEFTLYKPLMGRKNNPGIVRHIATEPEDAVQVLDAAYKEIRRRNALMEQYGATSLVDLSQLTGQRLKRLVLIFDEISIMTLDTTRIGKQTIGSWGTFLLAKIAALGRSAGVHIIIGTQQIRKEVLSGLIQANFEHRICFSVADWRQSQLVIESSEAVGLPVGRAFLRLAGQTTEYQTCLISPKQIRLEVARIAEYGPDGGLGGNEELTRFVKDAKLLVALACEQLNGDFSRAKLLTLPGVRGLITQERFNEIAQRLERDGVVDAAGPRKPRRVVRAFYGRAALLDSLYGLQTSELSDAVSEQETSDTVYGLSEADSVANREQTVNLPDAFRFDDATSPLEHQDAVNREVNQDDDTVYGLESDATCAPEPKEPEIDLPDVFRAAIDAADENTKKPKPRKRKS